MFGLQEIHKFNRDKSAVSAVSSLFGSDAISKLDAGLVKSRKSCLNRTEGSRS
ncbi:hypothetical protein PO124_22205 [Bacillus licheniformis]|nr:hypothetical protein [Bacillus licheniformis]